MAYTIGKLASATGTSVETVRFYERTGLIEQPVKPPSGFRRYPEETVTLIRFIKHAQGMGFTLEEVKSMLLLSPHECLSVQEIARQKRALIRDKISLLKNMESNLSEMITRCETSGEEGCHFLEFYKNIP